jgi:hypothetical protein
LAGFNFGASMTSTDFANVGVLLSDSLVALDGDFTGNLYPAGSTEGMTTLTVFREAGVATDKQDDDETPGWPRGRALFVGHHSGRSGGLRLRVWINMREDHMVLAVDSTSAAVSYQSAYAFFVGALNNVTEKVEKVVSKYFY